MCFCQDFIYSNQTLGNKEQNLISKSITITDMFLVTASTTAKDEDGQQLKENGGRIHKFIIVHLHLQDS